MSQSHLVCHMLSIEVIVKICNDEHADIIFQDEKINGANNEDDVLGTIYCRLFRTFVCFVALRDAKCSMKAVSDGNEEARVKHCTG